MRILMIVVWGALIFISDQSNNRYNALVERIEQLEADRIPDKGER